MNLLLRRDEDDGRCTVGTLWVGKKKYRTIEPPWLNNERNVSCIPQGGYKLKHRKSAAKGAHLHVLGVPGRKLILIHTGNFVSQTEGCILPGVNLLTDHGIAHVTRSRETMAEIVAAVPPEGCMLEIIAALEKDR